MPNFRYLAYNGDGKEIKGKTSSKDAGEAIALLKEKGLFVKEIKEEKKSGFRLEKGLAISDVFMNLSSMISSGVLVPDAVRSLSREAHGSLKAVMDDIYNNLIKGVSLSGAMEFHKDYFPQYICSMVKAGEESGTLDSVLNNLSDFLEKEKELKDRVKSAMIYPAFMITVSAILIFFVFVFVFPRITSIFIEQKIPLPFITKIMIGISSFLQGYWYIAAALFVGSFFAARSLYRKKRLEFYRFLFDSPVKALRNIYISRFCRVLGLLLGGGVPVIKALDYSKTVTGNDYLASEIEKIKNDVREGRKISDVALFLPPTYLQMIMTGERIGDLTGALTKISAMAEREFRKSVDNFLRFLEPSIILIMGVVVGFMVISILLPIFQMNQIIK
jgi:general secretion pathway protein F